MRLFRCCSSLNEARIVQALALGSCLLHFVFSFPRIVLFFFFFNFLFLQHRLGKGNCELNVSDVWLEAICVCF